MLGDQSKQTTNLRDLMISPVLFLIEINIYVVGEKIKITL